MKKYILILAVSLLFFSCEREEVVLSGLNDTDLLFNVAKTSISDEQDIDFGTNLVYENNSYSDRSNSNITFTCATITVDNSNPGEFPKTFTVDFGSTGCTNNGLTRTGTLTITLSDYLSNNGSTMTIVRGNDYFINGYKLEGTIVYQNTTTNPNIPSWSRNLTNGKITSPAGNFYTYTDTRNVELIAGGSTATLTDNTYRANSGTRTVNRSNGTSLTSTIATPLIKAFNCNFISEGSLSLQGSFLNGTLDFGNGACDNIAVYTHSNGQSYVINL